MNVAELHDRIADVDPVQMRRQQRHDFRPFAVEVQARNVNRQTDVVEPLGPQRLDYRQGAVGRPDQGMAPDAGVG